MTKVCWKSDLKASRDLSPRQIEGYDFLLSWFDDWRLARGLSLDRPSAVRFWKEAVTSKERKDWQLQHWAEALRWFTRWLAIFARRGLKPTSLPERGRNAVESAGARRGLARATRKTYRGWAVRFAAWAGSAERVTDEGCASEWLGVRWLFPAKQ